MFFIGTMLPMQFQSVAALAPYLVVEGGLSYTDIGVLTGLFMLPGAVLAAPGGMLAAWIGDRKALITGLTAMASSSILFAYTDSYAVMVVCRLVGGTGAVIINILLPKIVTDWFYGKEISTALATNASSFGLGIGVAMGMLPLIATPMAWQGAMQVNAGLVLLAAILLVLSYRDPLAREVRASERAQIWQISRPEFVLASLGGLERGLLGSGYVVFMSFMPPLLIAQGMAAEGAGLLTSVVAMVSLVSVPLGGYLSDLTGKSSYFVVGGSLSTGLICFIAPYAAPALLWVILFGFLRGGVTGGIMALPAQILRPEVRTIGFSVTTGVFFITMAALFPIAGYLLDATDDTAAPLWFSGLLWMMISIVLGVFKLLQRHWFQED